MSRNRFVDADTVKLDLTDGDWIEIKKELGVAERKRLEGSPMSGAHQQATADDPNAVEMSISWDKYFIIKLTTYIVDWSLVDKEGKRVKVSRAAIENLKDGDAEEMMTAINAHEEAMEEERKNQIGQPRLVKSS